MNTRRKTGVRGRPKISPEAVRRTVGVRLNASEWEAVQRKADSLGIRPSTLLRLAALARMLPPPVAPEVNRQAYAELSRLASNLNQLARAAHAGRVAIEPEQLEALYGLVQHLRLELIGARDDCKAD